MPQKHRTGYSKLNRTSAHRKALLRNLCLSLFTYGRIITTIRKAKEARRVAEKLITKAKKGGLSNFRRVIAFLQDRAVTKKLFEHIAQRFKDRAGGYTRIIKLGGSRWDSTKANPGFGQFALNQLGDNATRVVLELVVKEPREKELYLVGKGKQARIEQRLKKQEKKKTP